MMTEYEDKMTGKYIETVGRRKTATARIRMFASDENKIIVNDSEEVENYFPTKTQQLKTRAPFSVADTEDTFFVSVHVSGSGLNAQAEAIRHGIARAFVEHNKSTKKDLKDAGYLKRDPRMVERKKPGRKKARKSSQWSKR
jgi:small subunit ribosomal protein S9